MDDLVNMQGFAVTCRKGRRPGQVFGKRKQYPQPTPPAVPSKQQQPPMTSATTMAQGSTPTSTNAPPKEIPPYAPFANPTEFRLMNWFYNNTANGLSLFNFNELVDIFRSQEYEPLHIAKFDCVKANNKMNTYLGRKAEKGKQESDKEDEDVDLQDPASTADGEDTLASTTLPLSSYSGWHNGFVDIPLPRAGCKQAEDHAVTFRVEDICYRKVLSVIHDNFTDTALILASRARHTDSKDIIRGLHFGQDA
ncbi:hypothetical protein PM082_010043 [Marasmius tenuissimus]|nr:hypothetical protein PM082_010043 [Marasmius tenuissimus]